MNAREKLLLGLVGGLVGVFVIGLGGRAFFIKPIREADQKVRGVREKLEKITAERRTFFANEDRMREVASRTFAEDLDEASAASGALLNRAIINSRLAEADFSRLPVGPRRLRGAQEIGWSVRGEGPLGRVINLLFVLDQGPALHRIDGLVLAAGDAPGRVRVTFRYLTLVLTPSPEVERVDFDSGPTAEGPERRAYDPLVVRDFLRPYIPPPPPPAPKGSPPAPTPPPGPPGLESFRIVSLSDWGGRPEVHVRDLTREATLRFQPGDELAGGIIALVDYRPLPWPGRAPLVSHARVVIRIGNEYWAIERGTTLADRYKLERNQLPPSLLPESAAVRQP